MEQLDHVARGHSPAHSACHCTCPWVPPCSHTLARGENLSSPMHLPFLPVDARVAGEGPSSQEPHADAVRNIGFNELQNEAAAADMYGWCPHPPSPTLSQHCLLAPNCILLPMLSSSFSRKHPFLISRPIPGSATDAQTLRLRQFFHPGSTGGQEWRLEAPTRFASLLPVPPGPPPPCKLSWRPGP